MRDESRAPHYPSRQLKRENPSDNVFLPHILPSLLFLVPSLPPSLPPSLSPYEPMPTILFSVSTKQAPTCVDGSFDLIADRKATPMK